MYLEISEKLHFSELQTIIINEQIYLNPIPKALYIELNLHLREKGDITYNLFCLKPNSFERNKTT